MNLFKKSCLHLTLVCALSIFTSSKVSSNENYGLQFMPAGFGVGTFKIDSYAGDEVTNVNNTYYNSSLFFLGYRFNNSDLAIVSGFRVKMIYSEFYVQNEKHVLHGNVISVPLLLRWYFLGNEEDFMRIYTEIGPSYARDHSLEFLETDVHDDLLVNNVALSYNLGMRFLQPDGILFFDVYLSGDLDLAGADLQVQPYYSINCRFGLVFNRK